MLGYHLRLALHSLRRTVVITSPSVGYMCIGALIVLGLCQAAVLWPAWRAASIPPAIAARAL